ncbi:unnamed protein product, partial [marine sediment metagenome]
ANKMPSEYFPEHVWDKLTDIEKSDYSDSAKCFMLDSGTPSVMVSLRGAEASLRNYFETISGEPAEKKTWGQMTNALKTKAEELGIDDSFISFLDYIGKAKRNIAQHPNKIYSIREAVIIFMQTVAMVEDIYAKI